MTVPCLWMSISGDTSAPGTSAGTVCGDAGRQNGALHEWDMAGIQPSPAQAQNIREKRRRYSVCSGPYIRLWPYRPHRLGTGYAGQCAHDSASRPAASPLMTRLQDELRTESVRFRPVNSLPVRWTGYLTRRRALYCLCCTHGSACRP